MPKPHARPITFEFLGVGTAHRTFEPSLGTTELIAGMAQPLPASMEEALERGPCAPQEPGTQPARLR